MNLESRVDGLRRASELLEEAASMIEASMRMTGLESRSEGTVRKIRELSSSCSDGGSVLNLKRELEYTQKEHPGWTRPMASVKNVCRKDI